MNSGHSQNQRLSEVLRQLAAEERSEMKISELLSFWASVPSAPASSPLRCRASSPVRCRHFRHSALLHHRATDDRPPHHVAPLFGDATLGCLDRSAQGPAARDGACGACRTPHETASRSSLHALAERLTGIACFVLTLILFLPIPLANFPPALALILFALGLAEQDGVAMIGWFLSLITLVIALSVGYGIIAGGFSAGGYSASDRDLRSLL